MPNQRITAPVRSRHALNAIGKRSVIKRRNSVVLPEVDMVYETDLIRRGHAEALGNNRWRINDRVYVREEREAGTLFPESGPGIVLLTRNEYKALVTLARYNGFTEQAARELERTPDISSKDIEIARNLFAKRTKT
jgi:hypothetical protein